MKKLTIITISILSIMLLSPILTLGNTSQESFYSLGDLKLEIRRIVSNNSSSISLETKEGEKLYLDLNTLISSSDFAGIGITGDKVILYVKKNSWEKTREVTSKHINKRLALIANEEILLTPVVREPLSSELQISDPYSPITNLKTLTEKLKLSEKPDYFDKPEVYELFMKNWVNKHSSDYSANYELMILYLSDSNGSFSYELITSEKCKKAFPLLQKLIKIQPDDREFYSLMSICYLSSSKFNEALNILKSSLPLYPENEKWLIYPQIGNAYKMNGSYDEALKALEKAKTLLQNSKLLPEGMTIEMAKMFNSVSPTDDSIDFETIEDYENHLKQKSLNEIESFIEEIKNDKNL